MKKITVRVTDKIGEKLAEYCEQHNLNASEAGRIAFARLFAKPPKKAERESAKTEMGRPNIAEYNRKRHEE